MIGFRVIALTAIVLALHVSAFAVDGASEIGGEIFGFLKQDKSPYRVTETLVVPDGRTLIVEAGVTLNFEEGTGLDIRGGSVAVMGESNNPVVFTSINDLKKWNGISMTGLRRSEVQGLNLSNSVFGFTVESGSLELSDTKFERVERAAIYVRNGSVDLQWCKILNSGSAGIWATQSAMVNVDGSVFEGNHIGLVASDGSNVSLQSTRLMHNDVAILDMGENHLKQKNVVIQDNGIGIVARDLPSAALKTALGQNGDNVSLMVDSYLPDLGDEPVNPYAEGVNLLALKNDNRSDSSWNLSGNMEWGIGYHKVLMRRNHGDEAYVDGDDTVEVGDRYVNYFQVPGLFSTLTANIMMESPDGQTLEVMADLSSDTWTTFKAHSVQAIYTDKNQRIAAGDINVHAGELYLAGINLFGGSYDLNLFKNAANEPLFMGSAFAGELRAPSVVGDRNPDMYNDYIEDGEAEAQKLVLGGKVRWNMHRRFNGTLGFIGSKDFLEDPIIRDGMSENVNTASPLVTSHTFFADGNWLFFPGDVKLNGQVAVGSADTANAAKMHAINQVFSDAGLDASNFALLNRLMKNPNEVDNLSRDQLIEIFGDNNASVTTRDMRSLLKTLLAEASETAEEFVSEEKEAKPSHPDFWGLDHWTFAGSYEWTGPKTFIEGFFRYVGSEYYSAGSPDLVQNSRLLGGNLKQKIFDFWTLGFGYSMNVENADDGHKGYNVFGMAEGSQWGILPGAEDDWLEEHEQDENRTQYIHDAYLTNEFKLTEKIGLFVKYAMNYKTRSTSLRLYPNYTLASGIYSDPWFDARDGKSTMLVIEDGDTVTIDSARWAMYYDLRNDPYMASQFTERLLKQVAELGLTFKLPKNVLRVGGIWTLRSDLSKFEKDEYLDEFDFEDKTFGILGYYFHGGDFFEQRYPVSLATTVSDFHNVASVEPRYKIYERNDMKELEINVSDRMTFPLSKDFLDFSLNGNMRYNILNYDNEGESLEDVEMDVASSATLTFHHTKTLSSSWTMGAVYNYRPDNLSDEYRDIYGIASLSYEF